MYEYQFYPIIREDKHSWTELAMLLERNDIALDNNLDYTIGMYNESHSLIATGSYFLNTLRCMAVHEDCHGEGVLSMVISYLIDDLASKGVYDIFLYSKYESAKFFEALGFSKICTVDNTLIFMENRANGFTSYLNSLYLDEPPKDNGGAIVMNANPFTLGHQYLIEYAASRCTQLHVFVVSEDMSIVPFEDRYSLVKKGTSHIPNIVLHQTSNYLISSATFPSYFLREEDRVITAQANLDTQIYNSIAKKLKISTRFVGEEHNSIVTSRYNEILYQQLSANNQKCEIIPRKQINGKPISASTVRLLISLGEIQKIENLVPTSTYEYFFTPNGQSVIEKIKQCSDVVHY